MRNVVIVTAMITFAVAIATPLAFPASHIQEEIVFSSARAGTVSLWTVAPASGRLRRLTFPPAVVAPCRCTNGDADAHAVWAPTGERRLAFTRGRHVVVLEAIAGTGRAVPSPPPAEDSEPVWSSTGRLAFVRRLEVDGRPRHQIVAANTRGGEQRVLVRTGPFASRSLAWSPDGRTLAYVAAYPDPAVRHVLGLFLVSARGGRPRFLLRAAGMDDVSWSPDGQRLVFAASVPGAEAFDPYRIFTITRVDRRIVQLTQQRSSAIADATPRWSPDGTQIAFVRTGRRGSTIHTIRPDGSGLRLVARDATGPSWSPSGDSLAYVDGYSGQGRPLALSVVAPGEPPRAIVYLRHPADGNDLGPQAWR